MRLLCRGNTVVHLVAIYNNITAICYRYPAMRLGRKVPPPLPTGWPNREKFWEWIYPFHAISSNFGSAGRKALPPPLPSLPPMAEQGKILKLDLSISCNFQQLWFSWQKSTPKTLKSGGQYIKSVIWVRAAEGVTPRLTEQKGETCFPTRSTTQNERPLVGYGNALIHLI